MTEQLFIDDIEDGRLLGRGGFSTVRMTVDSRTGTAVAFKQYNVDVRKAMNPDALVMLADRAADLPELSDFAAWPLALVLDNQGICGFLMEVVPPRFTLTLKLPSGRSEVALAEFQYLLNRREVTRRYTGPVPGVQRRLDLLRVVAERMVILHSKGIVVGDLSPRNLLFSLAERRPSAYFLDCDGFVVEGQSVFPPSETPGWSTEQILGRREGCGPSSDSFKFGLLVLRLLVGDQTTLDTDALPNEDLKDILERSMAQDVVRRPSMLEWNEGISRARRRSPSRVVRGPGSNTREVADASARSSSKRPRGLNILLVATEWLPRKGGLSQFNRNLAIALARQGHSVYSTTLRPSGPDADDAAQYGISVVVPELVAGYADLNIRPAALADVPIEVVVGHDRFTGLAAVTQARQNFPGSTLVQIVHTMPEELEWLKGRSGATGRAEARLAELRAACRAADAVCAVGPRLHRLVTTMLHDGFVLPTVVRLDPGVDFASTGRPLGRVPGPEAVCLLLGRTDDPQLKGLDLGVAAFAGLPTPLRSKGKLVIRGAPESTGDDLHASLCKSHQLNRAELVVRSFDPMPGTVDADLRQASVLLMPSRGEGFGLVGLEAISVGTPVLVSSRSGLAELINEFGPPESRQFIVEVDDSGDQDVQRWKSALEGVLNDREQALSRTLHLWDWLNNKTSWLKLGARLGAETKRIRRVD